ncbi:MAG: type-F conjugative transfer system protein TraW [Pseudomonadota bacterium]
MWKKSALSVALVLSFSWHAGAEHLGTYGETFEISEEDLLSQIKRRLTEMRGNGELDRLEREFADRAKAKIKRPVPVLGISHTLEPRSWSYDPSWTSPEDIRDTEGRLVIAAGQTVNPLDAVRMRTPLLLIDGDQAPQVDWAVRQSELSPWGVKIILVNGAPFELEKTIQQPVFFDQEGLIATKFGIRNVPAKISQSERLLQVEEVMP